jgi:hypothetical protein
MNARNCGVIAALTAGAVLGASSMIGAQTSPFPAPKGLFTPAPPKTPQLQFDPLPRQNALRELRSRLTSERPKVVCGMTVIPVNPEIDPKSVKKAPDDKKYTMRSVPPPMCGSVDVTLPAPDSTPTGPTPNPAVAR